jgi:hypothetical protein
MSSDGLQCSGRVTKKKERTLNMKIMLFAGFESLMYGALEDLVLSIMHKLKFCVCDLNSSKQNSAPNVPLHM